MVQKLSKGFKEFLIKSSIFVVLFVAIQLVTMGIVAKTTLPGDLKFIAMDDLAEAALFMLVIFIGLNRDKILKIKSYSVDWKERLFVGVSMILGFSFYFWYKFSLVSNLELASKYIYPVTLIEYLLLFVVLILLLALVFGFKFLKDFFEEHKKNIWYMLLGVVVVYSMIGGLQGVWAYIGNFVASSVNYLLNFVGTSELYYLRNLPVLSFDGFVVGIAKTCSGIDSVLLFTGLYLGILAWDWKVLDKWKALWMYFVGVFGAFLLNIFRIFLLVLIGAYVSEEFALNMFHTNASSIIFLVYFGIYWKLIYKWMKL